MGAAVAGTGYGWLGGREGSSGRGVPGLAEMLWELTDVLAFLAPASGTKL